MGDEQAIRNYYELFDEDTRLASPMGRLEQERTRRIVDRSLPKPPARVLDVGGGTGPYSFWLASLGYEVHLLDLSERLIAMARDHAARMSSEDARGAVPSTIEVGDARDLPYDDSWADAVLMLGPLYHLPEREDRLAALREAARVSRSGAPLFVAGISRFASLLDGLVSGTFALESFRAIIANDLADGHHVNPIDDIRFFTDAYFHHPDELGAEIAESGYQVDSVLPVEGLAAGVANLEDLWADVEQRDALLDTLEGLEGEPTLAGATFHLLAVARRA